MKSHTIPRRRMRLWRITNRSVLSQSGVVYVEFLVVILPLLYLWFGLTQIGLMYGAHLIVNHAAARAARAAIVILPDDKEGEYAEEVNTIGSGASGGDAALNNYAAVAEDSRLRDIQRVGAFTYAPVMPSVGEWIPGGDTSVAGALQDAAMWDGGGSVAGVMGVLSNMFITGQLAVAVTFPDGAGGYLGTFGPEDMITVRVTALYKCSVPLVAGLVCGGISENAGKELDTVMPVAASTFDKLQSWSGSQFTALRAERTLPNQGV